MFNLKAYSMLKNLIPSSAANFASACKYLCLKLSCVKLIVYYWKKVFQTAAVAMNNSVFICTYLIWRLFWDWSWGYLLEL